MQNKQVFERMKEEIIYLLILLVISIIALKIVFFKESPIVILRLVLSFFWVFILPGFFIMFYWEDKLNFAERLIISVGLSAATTGIVSYYLGLLGLNVKYHTIALPLLGIIIGAFLVFKTKFSQQQSN